MLKKCIIFENERVSSSIEGNQVMTKADYSESGLLSNKKELTLIDDTYINIFISGIYNASANRTIYVVMYIKDSTEIFRYIKITESYFSSAIKSVGDIKTRDIIGELDSLVCAIGNCYNSRINKAVIHYNNDETFQWISGQLLPDNQDLSELRRLVLLDAEVLEIEFSKIISPYQINNNAIAKQLAEKVVIPEEFLI